MNSSKFLKSWRDYYLKGKATEERTEEVLILLWVVSSSKFSVFKRPVWSFSFSWSENLVFSCLPPVQNCQYFLYLEVLLSQKLSGLRFCIFLLVSCQYPCIFIMQPSPAFLHEVNDVFWQTEVVIYCNLFHTSRFPNYYNYVS